MNVRNEYYKIKKKYNLEQGIEELVFVRKYMNIWNLETANSTSASIALYGGGQHTKVLLNLLAIWDQDFKIACIIDNYVDKKQIKGIPVIRETDIKRYSIDLIWISAWNSRHKISNSLKTNYPYIKYIEPYKELEKREHCKIKEDLTTYALENKYKWFSEKKRKRRLSGTQEEKRIFTKQLISGYYEICDWLDFEKEINRLIDTDDDEAEFYKELLRETKEYLNEIKKRINKKQHKSYIIYLIDSLSKYVVEDMQYLSKWKKNSVEFVEYRNEYPSTKEVIVSFFTGWRPFENETYKRKTINYSDSKLLSYMNDNNINLKLLTTNVNIIKNFEKINKYNNNLYENAVISEIIFNGICEMVDDNCEQVILIHSDNTIHPTHRNPETEFIEYLNIKEKKQAHKQNFQNALFYTDKILEYYLNQFKENNNITEIVMGDHGINIDLEYCTAIEPQPCKNKAAQWDPQIFSPALMIKNTAIDNRVVKNLVSANQFIDILYGLIRKKDPLYYIEFKDIIPMEYVPGYDYEWVSCGVESRNYYLALGAIGCMSKEYIYLNLEDGDKLYYKIEGQELINIDNDAKKKEIECGFGENMLNLCKFPYEILKEEFFNVHRTIYNKSFKWL